MDKIELKAAGRDILGKKVRFLRRQGTTPVHLFGHGIESVALQCDTTELQRVLAEAGRTRLISLSLDKNKGPRNVVVREVQREPLAGKLLHVDFYQVKMAEKIRVDVPIVLVGESPALKFKGNMLEREHNTLTVECLPDKIPAGVELDIASLTEAEQAVQVKDIRLGEEVVVLNDPELVLVRISSRPAEKMEEEVVEVEAAVGAPEAAPSGEEKPEKE